MDAAARETLGPIALEFEHRTPGVAGGPTLRIHTRTTGNPGYAGDLAIAGVFTNVVSAYGLTSSLTPIISADGESASDHSSFWGEGYAAILAIEDDYNDFNDYYHSSQDTMAHCNFAYYTAYVKASVGTAAHLAALKAHGACPQHRRSFAPVKLVLAQATLF